MSFITAYCHISNQSLRLNGESIFSIDKSSDDNFAKQIYKHLAIDYPKFYKMDVLAKIAFLGVEVLKNHCPEISKYRDDEIALLFSNSVSSADTDLKFKKSYEHDGAPSPALFVYTLPHILTGEIAIRNKWYGENLFAVFPEFNPDFFSNFCNIHLAKTSKACLCGWINVLSENTEAFLFLVEKEDYKKNNLPLNSETLATLYKS